MNKRHSDMALIVCKVILFSEIICRESKMSKISYDILLYSSPYFENLVSEFYRISRYKRNIYKKIRNEEDYEKKLSAEEQTILKDLSEKENRILLEILSQKNWLNVRENVKESLLQIIGEIYETSVLSNRNIYGRDLP